VSFWQRLTAKTDNPFAALCNASSVVIKTASIAYQPATATH